MEIIAGVAVAVIALILIGLGALFGAAIGAWVPRWVKIFG